MHRAYRDKFKVWEVCHNFFGWEIIEKIKFFHFQHPLKLFWPLKHHLVWETPTFWVILLNFFNLSYGFRDSRGWFCPKMAVFHFNNSYKAMPGSKSFRTMTPLKLGVLRPKKGSKKVFRGPQKGKKMIIWKISHSKKLWHTSPTFCLSL